VEFEAFKRPDSSGKRPMLLVADADPWVKDPIVWILRQAQYEILAADDGTDAVTMFEQHAEEIVAVLLDYNLPGGCGDEVFGQLQRIRPGIPVIMMSGFAEDDVIGHFLGMGVVGFLKKPFGPLTLFQAVRKALGGSAA
jgi:DNA-binding response OmpR family regulator